MSWFLHVAIEHALQVLGWHENLTSAEIPPEHLWEDATGLEQWWEALKAKREMARTTGQRIEDLDDDLEQNELARALRA